MAGDLLKRLKPLIDAGIDLAQMSPARAEALVRELVRQGEVRRKEADALLAMLVVRGKGATGQAAEVARAEVSKKVAKQVDRVMERVAQLESTVASLSALIGRGSRPSEPASSGTGPTPASPPKPSSAAGSVAPTVEQAGSKKAPAKKAPAKKTATKAPAKKQTATKAPVKKAATKQASAKDPDAKSSGTA